MADTADNVLSSALDQARSRAHLTLKQQIAQRLGQMSNNSGGGIPTAIKELANRVGMGPAALLHKVGGFNEDAARFWAINHPAAMGGGAAIPAWVTSAFNKYGAGAMPPTPSAPFGVHPGHNPNPFPQPGNPTFGVHPGHLPAPVGGNNQPPTGVSNNQPPTVGGQNAAPAPVVPGGPGPQQLTQQQLVQQQQNQSSALNHAVGLVPLGQGLFVHPVTGEIHGLGTPMLPSGNVTPH